MVKAVVGPSACRPGATRCGGAMDAAVTAETPRTNKDIFTVRHLPCEGLLECRPQLFAGYAARRKDGDAFGMCTACRIDRLRELLVRTEARRQVGPQRRDRLGQFIERV